MPKYHEMQRKINILDSGGNVRPPKLWWIKILPTIRKEYPNYSSNEQYQILGGIWNNYNNETKIKIIREYQTDNNSVSTLSSSEKNILGKQR